MKKCSIIFLAILLYSTQSIANTIYLKCVPSNPENQIINLTLNEDNSSVSFTNTVFEASFGANTINWSRQQRLPFGTFSTQYVLNRTTLNLKAIDYSDVNSNSTKTTYRCNIDNPPKNRAI